MVHVRHTAQRVYGHGMIFGHRRRQATGDRRQASGVRRQAEERAAIKPYWQETGLVFTAHDALGAARGCRRD